MTDSEYPTIETLFCNLDRWRHFAGYPLESRVDALVGLFLPKVIEDCCGVEEMHPRVIPQLQLKQTGSNRSEKVDFFALSRDGTQAFLIELKTDMGSRNEKQREYLSRARDRGLACILSEFKEIAQASRSRRKYLHIIGALSEMGLLRLPQELEEMMRDGKTIGSTKLIGEIEVRPSTDSKIEVSFIQPIEDRSDGETGFRHIYFQDVADSIQSYGELGGLLACYLRRWETAPAPTKA